LANSIKNIENCVDLNGIPFWIFEIDGFALKLFDV
jgi:hypothetical protein